MQIRVEGYGKVNQKAHYGADQDEDRQGFAEVYIKVKTIQCQKDHEHERSGSVVRGIKVRFDKSHKGKNQYQHGGYNTDSLSDPVLHLVLHGKKAENGGGDHRKPGKK